ncbi:MAG: hypothetical protein F6K14_09775 [Symploca sp. SIO2C1]|nr:hypothetical protein [Symploca sp. SIO2C1]
MKAQYLSVLLGIIAAVSVSCKPNINNQVVVQQEQQEIKISSSGSTYSALKILVAAYIAKTENTKITFLPLSQS